MGTVAADIIIAWPSTVVLIPAGWTRETRLDSRYILGASTGTDADPTTDRGSATHTHTSPSHTPTQVAHTHSITQLEVSDLNIRIPSGTNTAASNAHEHAVSTTDLMTPTSGGVAITVDSTSNDLAYVEVIWLKSDGTPTGLPVGCLAFFESDTLPASWTRVHADKYLKGAAAGADGGATGGANTHTHTSPAHTHTTGVHYHTGTTGTSAGTRTRGTGTAKSVASATHVHELAIEETNALNNSVTTTMDTVSHEPPYHKINIVTPSVLSLPQNIICLWLGTHANIPTNWVRYTALDDKWPKGAAAGEGATTGGSTAHGHTASNCQPTQAAHSHTVTSGPPSLSVLSGSTLINNVANDAHTHDTIGGAPGFEIGSTVATHNAVAVTIDNISAGAAYPPHRTVIFIRNTLAPEPEGPSLGGYTSYDLGLFDAGGPHCERLPEEAAAAWRGDRRQQRQE